MISQVEDDYDKIKKNKYFQESLKTIEKERPVLDEKKLDYEDLITRKVEEKQKEKRKIKQRSGKKKPDRVTIETIDGNLFIGNIEKESKDIITIRTTVGRVKIEKNRIKKRENMK